MKHSNNNLLIMTLLLFTVGMLLLNIAGVSAVDIQPNIIRDSEYISGRVIGGEPGDAYQDYPYAVSVKITSANTHKKIGVIWVYQGPYYVNVKIFIGGNIAWEGELAAGGSSPTITANYKSALVIIEAPFTSSNYSVVYEGYITWIYN